MPFFDEQGDRLRHVHQRKARFPQIPDTFPVRTTSHAMPVGPEPIARMRSEKMLRIAIEPISKTGEILPAIPTLESGSIGVVSMVGQRVPWSVSLSVL